MPRYSAYALAAILAACGGIADQRSTDDAGPGKTTPALDGGVDTGTSSDGGAAVDGADATPPLPPAGVADGVCTPGDVTLGLYDPDCVYVLGSTQPGTAGKGALFHPDSPTRLAVGWGSYATSLTIRADRKILFTSMQPRGAFAFAPGLPTETVSQQYARHTLLATPGCGGTSPSLRTIVLHPRSGVGGPPGYYECVVQGLHYYEIGTSTELDIGGRVLMAIDETGAMLVRAVGGDLAIIDGAVERVVSGIEFTKMISYRSKRGGGFIVAAVQGDAVYFPKLYDLPVATGIATERGEYNMGSIRLTAVTALEPSGALEAMVTLTPPFADGIVRLRIDAPPEVLFDETKNAVQLHGSDLVTGP